MPTAIIQSLRNGITPVTGGSRDDLQPGDVVTVESLNIGTAYAWTLAYRPEGSTAAFSPFGGDVTKGPLQFNVDREGPYLIGLQYSTPEVNVVGFIPAGTTLTINGVVLTAVPGAPGVNEFQIGPNAAISAQNIHAALNSALNGFSGFILAHHTAGSTQIVITPVVDGTAIAIVPSSAEITAGIVTTTEYVRLRALTEFGSLHLVAAGEQYGGSNPPVPVDITPVGWTNEQNGNLLSLLSIVETVSSSGNIVYVDPVSGDYNDIQQAINYCVSQAPTVTNQWVVAVRPGTYEERLTFAPFVHVIGWPGTTEFTSFFAGAEVVKVRQTAAMSAHSIVQPNINDCLFVSGIHFERPGAGPTGVILEDAGNRGLTHFYRCRITNAGTAPCYEAQSPGAGPPTILEDCYAAADAGWAVVVGEGSYTQLIRCRLGGQKGIELGHSTTAVIRDCWIEPMGAEALSVVFTSVTAPGTTIEATYTRFKGSCSMNTAGIGCNTGLDFRAYWCDFRNPGTITMDGTNVPANAANIKLGASRHGTISAINGAAFEASVPADTIFYDNALVSHSRLIGATEIAGDLTAENVQDALDEIYSYAINVRTLDDAYDAGMVGGGLGRDIYADAGAVRILDGNPPSDPTPITATDGQLKVVSKVEIGSIDKAEIKLDPNPWGMGAEITLGEELWVGNAPYGTPTFIWANSTGTATYHNYDLILSAHPTQGGDQVGSIIVRGGAGLNSGKGTDPSGGDVHLLGGDALGENVPAGPSAPIGGNVYIAPGGVRFPATAGDVGTILLGRPEDATRAVLNAPVAYAAPAAAGSATFGTDLGAFTINFTGGETIGSAIGKFNNTQYVIATENPAGFIQLETATKGPLAQVFYVGGDAAIQTALGDFQAALQTNGAWPSHMEVVVSAANEISFGPNAATGPLIYNADTGKLTVPGVIDPTGMIFSESTLTNITLPANGWTGTNIGGLYVSDGTDGQDNNHLYYVFEDGSFVKLSGGGTGDVVGPASSIDNAVVRFDGITGKVIQNSNATLADNGDLTLAGSITIDINAAGTDAYTLINRFSNAASSAVIHTTGAVPDWTTGTITGNNDYTIADGGGTERFKVSTGGAVTINNSYTLPTTDGAAVGEVLTTDAAGNVTWAAPGGGGSMTRFFIEDSAGNTSTILNDDTIIFDNSTGETTVAVSGDNVSIGLANTGVTAGTYISPVIAVDSTGRITSALNAAGLQGAYDYGNTLVTSGPTDITFTLSAAGGGFIVNGDGNVMFGVVSRVGTFSANSTATATLSSLDQVDINANNGTVITRNGGLNSEILTLTQSGGQSFGIFAGTADPSGSVTADAGSLFIRDTGATAELYQNTSVGSGTTWSQVGAGGGGLPAPTAEGQILYAATPAAFVQATPLVNTSGFILVNSSGNMVVI